MYSMKVQNMFMKHTHAEHAGDRHTVNIYDVMVASSYTNSCQQHCWSHCQSVQQFLFLTFLPRWHLTAFHPYGDGKCFYVRHKTEITKINSSLWKQGAKAVCPAPALWTQLVWDFYRQFKVGEVQAACIPLQFCWSRVPAQLHAGSCSFHTD